MEICPTSIGPNNTKLMTITHVDTSTAVGADVKGLAALGREHGVLSESHRRAAGIGIGRGRATGAYAFRKRKAPVGSYYADWTQWLPIMEAYEARRPGYYGTPPVNLIWALNVSLGQILDEGQVRVFQNLKYPKS